jgi:hypothetical protein
VSGFVVFAVEAGRGALSCDDDGLLGSVERVGVEASGERGSG